MIREESLRIIDRSRKLRKSDNDIKTDKAKKPDAHKDIKPDAHKDIKPDKHMNTEEKEDSSERSTYPNKINEQINQVNLLARTRNDLSKNVKEILKLMNELHDEMYDDDLRLGPVELN